MKFICPKCSGELVVTDGGAVCPMRHSFDRSREGYYNLLLANAGGTHGDNREMLDARRRFLDTGAYQPLADLLKSIVLERLSDGGSLLDIGCGEGYYTAQISKALEAAGKSCALHGFDVSKEAVRLSAKRVKGATFAVASAYRMPIADGSFDMALNVFSPLAKEETVRILRHGGYFLMAIPDENHLFGLKSAIYKNPYKNQLQPTDIDGLRLLETRRISYTLTLEGADVAALFKMTPYAYRTSCEDRARILALSSLTTEVAFVVFLYEKI